jgi:hypothetical protein
MEDYIGLEVSMKETAISIRRDGKRVWRGKCASDPKLIADLIRKRASAAKRAVFETGPLSVCSIMRRRQKACQRSASMHVTQKRFSTWPLIRLTLTTQMAWPISQCPSTNILSLLNLL